MTTRLAADHGAALGPRRGDCQLTVVAGYNRRASRKKLSSPRSAAHRRRRKRELKPRSSSFRIFATLERLRGQAGVAGKIVLFDEKFDERWPKTALPDKRTETPLLYRGRGPEAASKLGAVAAVIRSVGGDNFAYRTRANEFRTARTDSGRSARRQEDADKIAHLSQRGVVRMSSYPHATHASRRTER